MSQEICYMHHYGSVVLQSEHRLEPNVAIIPSHPIHCARSTKCTTASQFEGILEPYAEQMQSVGIGHYAEPDHCVC